MSTNSPSASRGSKALKAALFVTGFTGIVAEYALSTLASYFIGDAILQFTLIVSIMLFSMGLGSRLSRSFKEDVIGNFIVTELILSLLIAFSALLSYSAYSLTTTSWVTIYLLAIAIGLLIGLEIPFATRINEKYEELRLNISSILEKDYFGSLLGGLFFAFVGLPILGLTYTPFVLGALNLVVAFWLYLTLKESIPTRKRKLLGLGFVLVACALIAGAFSAQPIIQFGEQAKYKDKIIFSEQTKYQKIVMTEWGDNFSLYINGNQQISSFDEFLYHEPMVHIPVRLAESHDNILILGGGDGCIARDLLQYEGVKTITLVDLDQRMIDLGTNHPELTFLNANSMSHPKVTTVIEDAYQFVESKSDEFDLIIVDLPDPNSVDLNKLYSKEFYNLCRRALKKDGLFITQAGSPYYATKAFYCIEKTMRASGFSTVPMHNQVLTLGEWGWIIGAQQELDKEQITSLDIPDNTYRWLSKSALSALVSFGHPLVDTTGVEVNTIFSPVLYRYYRKGNWRIY